MLVSGWPIEAIASRTLAGVNLRGRPPLRPRARAEASPAMVRSDMSARSYSANAAKDPEHEFPCRGGGVDCSTLPGEHFETDPAVGEVMDGGDEVVEASTEPVQFPNHQGVPVSQRLETGDQPWSVIDLAGGLVLVELFSLNTSIEEGVALQVDALGAVGFRDAHVANQHGRQPPSRIRPYLRRPDPGR